jgi:hypothetical protein
LDNDAYLGEEMATFPKLSGALFSRELVTQMFPDGERVEHYGLIPAGEAGRLYIMAVDSALLMDYTQILVFEVTNVLANDNTLRPGLKCVYWREVSPEEITGSDPYPVVDAMKIAYMAFEPRWVCNDGSTQGGIIAELAVRGRNAIPRGKFIQNKTAENKEILGLVWHGEFIDEMYKNLKTQLLLGTISIPHVQPFASKMMDELTSLEAKAIATGRYNKISARRGHKKDMASALAMGAWYLKGKLGVKSTKKIGVAGNKVPEAPIGSHERRMSEKYAHVKPWDMPVEKKSRMTTKLGGVSGIGMARKRKRRRRNHKGSR